MRSRRVLLGFLLIGAGVAMLIFQGTFSGAWLVFLGGFVLISGMYLYALAGIFRSTQTIAGTRGGWSALNRVEFPADAADLGRYAERLAPGRDEAGGEPQLREVQVGDHGCG